MLGKFTCADCGNEWYSGKIATMLWFEEATDQRNPVDRYCTQINCQRCKQCDDIYGQLDIDVENYVRKVVRAIKLWKGLIEGIVPDGGYKSTRPHDSERCHGCELGICEWDS
ncbi:MAG: hypothetical protein J3Q66DRAFT_329545 [Benniella sp.]|nr:MAG: hypothetical protein J3Q66DRAFT_329545 [Benniella sp.]